MKTRIISGAVLIALVAGILAIGKTVSPIAITFFVVFAAVIATFELLGNAAKIKSSIALIGAAVYTALNVIALDKWISSLLFKISFSFYDFYSLLPYIFTAAYFVFAVAVILKNHKAFPLDKMIVFAAMPLFLSYSFGTLGNIVSGGDGIYHLLLLLNFSAVCDTGAYFVGSKIGRIKLCPNISPKKTVEGAVGGIICSIIVGIILVLSFGKTENLIATLLLTIPFCILGIMGDLFASVIKRSVGLKDYGSLIPGHGGVLDRVDSIIMIAPVLYIFVSLGVI